MTISEETKFFQTLNIDAEEMGKGLSEDQERIFKEVNEASPFQFREWEREESKDNAKGNN